jgi:hypothetical protein
MLKFDVKNGGYKLIKMALKKCPKSMLKKSFIIDAMGGSKIIKIDVGDPGPLIYKFFEISSLFAKTVQISTPKIDPKSGPIENVIPHKNACTFAPMGVRKCHFLGGRGADRFLQKR